MPSLLCWLECTAERKKRKKEKSREMLPPPPNSSMGREAGAGKGANVSVSGAVCGARESPPSIFMSTCVISSLRETKPNNLVLQRRTAPKWKSWGWLCAPARGALTYPPSLSPASHQLISAPLGQRAPSPALAGVELSVPHLSPICERPINHTVGKFTPHYNSAEHDCSEI